MITFVDIFKPKSRLERIRESIDSAVAECNAAMKEQIGGTDTKEIYRLHSAISALKAAKHFIDPK